MNKDMKQRPLPSRKRALVGFAVVCVVLLAALGLGSDYMLRYALRPTMAHSHDLSWRFHNIIDENPQLRPGPTVCSATTPCATLLSPCPRASATTPPTSSLPAPPTVWPSSSTAMRTTVWV